MTQKTLLALNSLLAPGAIAVAMLLISPAGNLTADSPRTLKLGETRLQLNGTGFRKKTLMNMYEGALYLSQRSRDAAAIIAADQPMAIRIRIVSGFVSQSKMVAALNDGFQNSTGGQTDALQDEIDQFRSCFSDDISKNDVFVISYLPGSGIIVHKNGQQKAVIAGLEFKQAVFGIWLSDRPADANLKAAMLGR